MSEHETNIKQLPKKNAPAHAEIIKLLADYLECVLVMYADQPYQPDDGTVKP